MISEIQRWRDLRDACKNGTFDLTKWLQDEPDALKLWQRFWMGLLEQARARTRLHRGNSAGHHNCISTGAGKSGLRFDYVIHSHHGEVLLYINRGKDSEAENKAIFDMLKRSKDVIEKEFGGPLEWHRLEGKRASVVGKRIEIGGWRDEPKWPEIQDAMIDAMIRLEKALKPHIAGLRA